MAYYGNLAYKYEYMEEKTVNREKRKQAPVKKKKIGKRKSKLPAHYIRNLIYVLVFTASAGYMIVQLVEIRKTTDDLEEARSKYTFEESVTAQKSFEFEQSIDLSKIEQEATTRLGMRRPERHQVVYVDVPRDDVSEKTAGEVEGFKNRFIATIGKIKSNIVNFFAYNK